jgi:hypothetical protein
MYIGKDKTVSASAIKAWDYVTDLIEVYLCIYKCIFSMIIYVYTYIYKYTYMDMFVYIYIGRCDKQGRSK